VWQFAALRDSRRPDPGTRRRTVTAQHTAGV